MTLTFWRNPSAATIFVKRENPFSQYEPTKLFSFFAFPASTSLYSELKPRTRCLGGRSDHSECCSGGSENGKSLRIIFARLTHRMRNTGFLRKAGTSVTTFENAKTTA